MSIFKTSEVTVGEEKFTVKELSARQRQEIFKMHEAGEKDPVEIQAHMLKMACEQFGDKDIESIIDLPGTAFDEIAKSIMVASGLEEMAMETAEKN